MLSVRQLTEEERQHLAAGGQTDCSFTRRRCQVLLASAEGQAVRRIAEKLRCNTATVWEVIHAFNRCGLACLRKHQWQRQQPCSVMDVSQSQRLRLMLRASPRDFGKPKKRWSLVLLAEVCSEQGLAARDISREGMRQAIERFGIQWKQARLWVINPELC